MPQDSWTSRARRAIAEALDPAAKWRRLAAQGSVSMPDIRAGARPPGQLSLPSPHALQEHKSLPLNALLPSSLDGRPYATEFDAEKVEREGLRNSSWIYGPIHTLATSLGMLDWQVFEWDARQDRWEPRPQHPLKALIDRPNPLQSRKAYFERMAQQLYLTGNAVSSMVMGMGRPQELWPLESKRVKPVPTRDKSFIKHYEYKIDGGRKELLATEEVVHVQFQDPATPWWGMSPMTAAMNTLETDLHQGVWQRATLARGAQPTGIVSTPPDWHLAPEQRENIREAFAAQHQGPENAGAVMVLDGGITYQAMSFSPKELDFIASRKMNREEFAMIFRVPLPMLQIYENATLANIETARRIFWEDTMMPLAQDFGDIFNLSLVPYYGDPTTLQVRPVFSRIPAMWEVFSKKVDSARRLFDMGVPMARIDEMLELGLGEYEGHDVGRLPSGLAPVTPTPAAPTVVAETEGAA